MALSLRPEPAGLLSNCSAGGWRVGGWQRGGLAERRPQPLGLPSQDRASSGWEGKGTWLLSRVSLGCGCGQGSCQRSFGEVFAFLIKKFTSFFRTAPATYGCDGASCNFQQHGPYRNNSRMAFGTFRLTGESSHVTCSANMTNWFGEDSRLRLVPALRDACHVSICLDHSRLFLLSRRCY